MAEIPVYDYSPSPGRAGGLKTRWWKEKDPGPHVLGVAAHIEEQQADREAAALIFARLYANQPLMSLYQLGLVKVNARPSVLVDSMGTAHRVSFNVVQSCIDTAAAKIAKNKPRALFLTSGGNWSLQRRAKGLTKFTDGLFHASRIYEHGQEAFLDACVWGTGALKHYIDRDEKIVASERVLPFEILVDDTEAIYGKPRCLYQRKWVHRDVLLEMFPDHKTAIEAAPTGDPTSETRGSADMVQVIEAWHLPSAKGASDGRHVWAIQGATLVNEKWSKSYFPFTFFHWNRRRAGFWGQGIAEQLVGIQIELNKLLRNIQRAQHLGAVLRIFVEEGSNVTSAHINNEIGAILKYRGAQPILHSGTGAAPELYQHLERLYQKAYELVGVSQLSANARKPEGLDAAVALREFHDIESERFVVVAQRYEQMFLDAAAIQLDLARDLYANSPSARIKAPGTKLLEEIEWHKVALREDQYVLRAFPTSILPTTPAGRLQRVQELVEAGFIDKERGMALLDFPDLESEMSLQVAAIEDVRRIVERIVDDGEYETPEPEMNLELAVKIAHSAYLKARGDGTPEKHVERLLQFMSECRELLDQIAEQAAPPAPPVPPEALAAPPGAMPPVPPVPDMAAGMAGAPAVPSELPVMPAPVV